LIVDSCQLTLFLLVNPGSPLYQALPGNADLEALPRLSSVSCEAEPRDTHSQAEPGNEKGSAWEREKNEKKNRFVVRTLVLLKLEELGKNKR
jgi:hypothetical protein